MEKVEVMTPSIVNNDELSDETESINLDLHVSDTEESTEIIKKTNIEYHNRIESEEDILNKYVDDISIDNKTNLQNKKNGMLEAQYHQTYRKCNGIISAHDGGLLLNGEKGDSLNETALNEKIIIQTVSMEIGAVKDDATKENLEEFKQQDNNEKKAQENDKYIGEDYNTLNETTDKDLCDKMHIDASTEEKTKDIELRDKSAINDNDKSAFHCMKDMNEKPSNEKKGYVDNEDNDDLLCVMEEKSIDEANENKDENSCSASEKDDEIKDNDDNNDQNIEDNAEANEEMNEETQENVEDKNEENLHDTREEEDTEENIESPTGIDIDASECAMDIEDSDIGGVVYTDTRIVSSEQLDNLENKIESDEDANKENEHSGDITLIDAAITHNSTVDNVLRNNNINGELRVTDVNIQATTDEEEDKEITKKSTKRQLSDSSPESESAKKIKLQTEEIEKSVEKEKHSIKLLDSFKKFMLDKKLKKLTRFELEELCIQKMCECIVNKSEIGELRQKVMIQEQTIDTWRKEAIVVAKQTRDLKIVHERLMADLRVMKEQTGKPLVPVKITRSVGLQAIIENSGRVRPPTVINGTPPQQQRSPVVNSNQQQSKPIPPPQNRQQIKPKAQPQRINITNNNRPLQPITQKSNVSHVKSRQTLSSPQQSKKHTDPKAVIDLTDEDEKNQNAKQSMNTGSPTVRILNKQNLGITAKAIPQTANSQSSKLMFVAPNVLQRNSAVMVKMNSNGLVNAQNGLTTIPSSQVSVVTSPIVRTVSQVKVPVSSVTTVRTTTPVKQIYKHPAPLPTAPSYHNSLSGKKPIPPKPHLNLTRSICGTGIVLQWKMPYKLDVYETIISYQLYAYQETKSPPKTDNWGKIGDVKALELPMAVTLTQFAVGNRYFFAVRAVDLQKRLGPFSDPENILL